MQKFSSRDKRKKEVLQYLTSSEEELFDAAKATTVTKREKTRGPMTNLHTIIPFKMMVRQ